MIRMTARVEGLICRCLFDFVTVSPYLFIYGDNVLFTERALGLPLHLFGWCNTLQFFTNSSANPLNHRV